MDPTETDLETNTDDASDNDSSPELSVEDIAAFIVEEEAATEPPKKSVSFSLKPPTIIEPPAARPPIVENYFRPPEQTLTPFEILYFKTFRILPDQFLFGKAAHPEDTTNF